MRLITKKITALILCIALCMGLIVSGAYAAGTKTPSKSGKKAIIAVPGMIGSELYKGSGSDLKKIWLTEDVIESRCDKNGNPVIDTFVLDDSVSPYGTLNTFEGLIDTLRENFDSRYGGSGEYEVRFFSYDWRMSNQVSAKKLNDFITENGYDKVILVAHSMGGIVSSVYMAEYGYDKIEKYISLGTPYYGSAKALYAFETGKFLDNIIHIEDALVKYLAPNVQGIYELLPIEQSFDKGGYVYDHNSLLKTLHASELLDYEETEDLMTHKTWYNDKLYKIAKETYSKQYAKNTVAGVYEDIQNNVVDSYIIAGYNTDTINGIVYSNGTVDDVTIGNGDGIVSLMSATMNNAKFARKPYFVKNVEHIDMVNNKGVAQLVTNIINGKGDTLGYAWGCGLLVTRRTAPYDIEKVTYKVKVYPQLISSFFDRAVSFMGSVSELMIEIQNRFDLLSR